MFPDQSHINRVRDALWQRPEGCASVMVGAGFSHNARATGPDAPKFPLWQELARAICIRLYPTADSYHLRRATAEASGTSGFLRLAQEYQAAFGKGPLHDLILELVPDEYYVPDDLHNRLLSLPWRDVFTTNWDTLLERTRRNVTGRLYRVVRSKEELPTAPKPRIVKLHGSFPAHFPFIFTEEDYRTYPQNFAPFVNTVQQAMIETVFCLIGFSGDDPNFLQWSGWVRDNLGVSTPKIYLAGWLDLSPHRRRMLEDRNVVPIDLARHPKADTWPEHLRHQYATDWILHTLERGKPYDFTKWPIPPDWSRAPIPEALQPVEEVKVNAPKAEPKPPDRDKKPTDYSEEVRSVVSVWEHNRKVYPGWLAIPLNKYFTIARNFHSWEGAIIHALPILSTKERLSALRELVWLKENLLEPLTDRLEEAIQAVLDSIDCEGRKIEGVEERAALWANIRDAWRNLALSLLTAARQRFDREAFDRCLTALAPFLGDHPDVSQRIHHERCLWAIYDLDFATLDKLLEEWHPEGCDPAWMMRKAAICFECNREDEAVRLLNLALSVIREDVPQGDSLAGPSREGWGLWMALGLELGFSRSTTEVLTTPPVWGRWEKLAPLQCDAFAQKRDIFNALQGDPEKQDGPLFDLGARRGKTIDLSNKDYELWINARRIVRLCEVTALPPTALHFDVGKNILEAATDALMPIDYKLASRLALRLTTYDKNSTFNRVWSRSRIAAIPIDDVTCLVYLVSKQIEYFTSHFLAERLRVAIEALSRLVLRLPPKDVERIFKRSLDYYRLNTIAMHPWLSDATNNLLKRSWETLNNERRGNLIFDVLSSPIVGLDRFEASNGSYPDPGELPGLNLKPHIPKRLPENEKRWAEVVQLIVRGLRCAGEARERAANRLVLLVLFDCLAPTEIDMVTQALWHGEHTDRDGLPVGTSLHDWVFLLLPEPKAGIAEQRFREKWFGLPKPPNRMGFNEYFWRVGNALTSLYDYNQPLVITEQERENLMVVVDNWFDDPLPKNNDPFYHLQARFGISSGIAGLSSILIKIYFPISIADKLFAKMVTLNQTKTPGYRLSAGLTKLCPDRIEDVTNIMRIGLASDDADVSKEALLGLEIWLKAASTEDAQPLSPPDDLVQEVGYIIATRRKGALKWALRLALWIFSGGSNEQKELIAQSVLHGLAYLIKELSYDLDHGENSNEDVPLLRWRCAYLALAMLSSGYENNETIKRWVEVSQNDPLPEVRHAERPEQVFTN